MLETSQFTSALRGLREQEFKIATYSEFHLLLSAIKQSYHEFVCTNIHQIQCTLTVHIAVVLNYEFL